MHRKKNGESKREWWDSTEIMERTPLPFSCTRNKSSVTRSQWWARRCWSSRGLLTAPVQAGCLQDLQPQAWLLLERHTRQSVGEVPHPSPFYPCLPTVSATGQSGWKLPDRAGGTCGICSGKRMKGSGGGAKLGPEGPQSTARPAGRHRPAVHSAQEPFGPSR